MYNYVFSLLSIAFPRLNNELYNVNAQIWLSSELNGGESCFNTAAVLGNVIFNYPIMYNTPFTLSDSLHFSLSLPLFLSFSLTYATYIKSLSLSLSRSCIRSFFSLNSPLSFVLSFY